MNNPTGSNDFINQVPTTAGHNIPYFKGGCFEFAYMPICPTCKCRHYTIDYYGNTGCPYVTIYNLDSKVKNLTYILNCILNFNMPSQKYVDVISSFVADNKEEWSDELANLLIHIISRKEESFNIITPTTIDGIPSSKSPERMIQFVALQYLIKNGGLKYKEQILSMVIDEFRNEAEGLLSVVN